jgi:hypothetical protein
MGKDCETSEIGLWLPYRLHAAAHHPAGGKGMIGRQLPRPDRPQSFQLFAKKDGRRFDQPLAFPTQPVEGTTLSVDHGIPENSRFLGDNIRLTPS